MKRIAVSILVGLLFPIAYAASVDFIGGLALADGFDTMYVDGTALPSLLFAPVVLPIYIDHFLRSNNYFGFWSTFDSFWFRGTFYILFNLSFYSILTYLLLRRFGWLSGKKVAPTPRNEVG